MVSFSPEFRAPLHGVRVLSFGSFVAGNICALMLAELGAEVVKIESKDRPEALRAYDAPGQAEVYEPSGIRTTALFAGMTRSLRSVCINMTNEFGRDTFRSLVAKADVVLENLGPGTMTSWNCAFADLRVINPALVMLSISGYGRTGPLAQYRAYASNINNFLGLTSAWAPDGIHFDFVAGTHGASGVVAALAAVDQGAPGVLIDMAQTEAGAAIMAPLYLDFLANGREWNAEPNEVPGSLCSGVFRCAGDDAWLAVELEDLDDWATMCALLDRSDLDLSTGKATVDLQKRMRAAIGAWCTLLTPFQAALKLQQRGLAAGPVQNSEDLWRDVQLRDRGAFIEVHHPDLGSLEYPEVPTPLGRIRGETARRGPRLGEHTDVVLREWMGYNATELTDLETQGAIWRPDGDVDAGD